ncbi:hypothetical protein DM860_010280 [Cuscuta australis]|uniref:H15 domain-containing protein n=1 Tax=Cuscuta australis TaxID=267555 RepID=A0A328D7G8_9ASTE|nr:hypothetical protein DM860_010280 [Cuscuta australis]
MDSLMPSPPSPPPLETVELPEPARLAEAANPTPARNHPPYAEMITAAVAALKEANGSSKQSISRYIEQLYSDLPPTHSALLTQHLKQMKNTGQLVMVKHSYQLPRSPTQQLEQQPLQMEMEGNGAPVAGMKRRPGRPPKLKPETQLQLQDSQLPEYQPEMEFHQDPLFQFQPDPISQSQFQLQDPGPPQFHAESQFEVQPPFPVQDSQNVTGMEPESVFASLGLVDAPPLPQKRGPGRPRKMDSEVKSRAPQSLAPLVKRGPGRPPKGGLATSSVRTKGRSGLPRGRPKRSLNSAATGPPSAAIAKKVGGSGRPRGRPKKNAPHFGIATGGLAINVPINYTNGNAATATTTYAAPPFAAAGASNGGVLPSMPKRRGRPPLSSTQLPASSSEGGMAPPPPRPRGRPPRSSYTAGGHNKYRKLSGRPPGRPRKSAPLVAPIASYSHHSALQGEHEQLVS